MRSAKKADGLEHHEHCSLCADDVLVISENSEKVLREGIGRCFELKEESIGPPKMHLDGCCRKVQLDNGAKAWGFSSSQCVQAAAQDVESCLKDKGQKLPTKAETPLQTSCCPAPDASPELGATEALHHQSLIGMLRWMVELGSICLDVSMMSSHSALPCQGHLKQLHHVFAHLKKCHNTEMMFDPSDPVIDKAMFEKKDWTSGEFGGMDLDEEALPPNMPQPRGLGFRMRAKVDADHAGDTITR